MRLARLVGGPRDGATTEVQGFQLYECMPAPVGYVTEAESATRAVAHFSSWTRVYDLVKNDDGEYLYVARPIA